MGWSYLGRITLFIGIIVYLCYVCVVSVYLKTPRCYRYIILCIYAFDVYVYALHKSNNIIYIYAIILLCTPVSASVLRAMVVLGMYSIRFSTAYSERIYIQMINARVYYYLRIYFFSVEIYLQAAA